MARYKLSKLAEADLEAIADYSVERWGEAQAIRYLDGLLRCCERIVAYPQIGRRCEALRTGYRRMEQGRHVLFYQLTSGSVVVQRILHQDVLPEKHVMDDPAD
jgi:toxin ParE1/3/4